MAKQGIRPVGPGNCSDLPVGEAQLGVGEGPIQPGGLIRRFARAQIVVEGGAEPLDGGRVGSLEGVDDGPDEKFQLGASWVGEAPTTDDGIEGGAQAGA